MPPKLIYSTNGTSSSGMANNPEREIWRAVFVSGQGINSSSYHLHSYECIRNGQALTLDGNQFEKTNSEFKSIMKRGVLH